MIDNASIEQLKSQIDIVDIISNYLEIKKAGANYKANCPFHGEKTPSFVISPAKQIYHCFGCGAGGDAIKFVQEHEKLNYPEAIEKIASLMNFSLNYTQGSSNNNDARRVLEQVQAWYIQNLDHTSNALHYLRNRGITQQSIETFGIGYVGASHEMMNFLSANMLTIPNAQEAGVVAQRERGGFYARLTERITFPIYAPSGAIVGFGGRTITNHPAKYINSPQTKLFNKSRLLYGYSKAKQAIYKNKKLIVCEGYLDVIMFHQAGFHEAVATLGTALTTEHLPLLRKGEPHVVLAYDGDNAGVAAALKAATMLSEAGFDGSVVLFPDGQDPADMIATGHIQEVANLLRSGQVFIPFVIEMMAKARDLTNPREKELAFEEIKNYLDKLTPIIRDAYLSHASTVLGVNIALFGVQTQTQTKVQNKNHREQIRFDEGNRDDIAQLSIIKTLVENSKFINKVSNVIDASMFGKYGELLQMVIEGKSNPEIVGLSLDESVKVMDEEELSRSLSSYLFRFYSMKLKTIISDTSLPIQQKSFMIRKIKMDILPRLKRGELVTYEF
jgi:DNA primase